MGVEKELARESAQTFGLLKLCTFIEADFTAPQFRDRPGGWLNRIGATHAYDKVFSNRSWDPFFALIEHGPSVVGASLRLRRKKGLCIARHV
jgi:hypothetical protein